MRKEGEEKRREGNGKGREGNRENKGKKGKWKSMDVKERKAQKVWRVGNEEREDDEFGRERGDKEKKKRRNEPK